MVYNTHVLPFDPASDQGHGRVFLSFLRKDVENEHIGSHHANAGDAGDHPEIPRTRHCSRGDLSHPEGRKRTAVPPRTGVRAPVPGKPAVLVCAGAQSAHGDPAGMDNQPRTAAGDVPLPADAHAHRERIP